MIAHRIGNVLAACLALFLSGLALIALGCIYNFVTEHHLAVDLTLLILMRVTAAIVVAYFGFNLWLSVEYRAIENERYRNDGQTLELVGEYDNEGISRERKICEMFDNMSFTNSLSINEIAREFFGGSGGKQNQQVKNILEKHGRKV